ncbi:MAG: purine permease, partial [Bacilli bacterium]|nr:purine permease [Bacilli bacterium]
FGIQHVLSMFVANVAPILICCGIVGASEEVSTNAIQSAIFMAAIGTTVQLFPIWRIGGRLPIVVGVSFTFLSVLSLIGAKYGLGTMFVSVMIGGLIIGVLGLFAHKWRRFIKPIVSALVVLGIGLSLIPVGIGDFLSTGVPGVLSEGTYHFDVAWPYLLVAGVTLVSGILWQIFVRGVFRNFSILVGLVVGYITALCLTPAFGLVDFSGMVFQSVTDFINVPRPFFVFSPIQASDFRIGAILAVLLIYVVATTEGIGDVCSLTETGLGREPTGKEISGAIAADGFTSALAGFFGAMPLTTFAQNVGIVSQTKVVNRFVIFQGAILLFLASFFPPISRFLQTIPPAVLGGMMLMLFASIAVLGMQMIAKNGFGKKNVLIVSLSIGLGYGLTLVPEFTGGIYENEIVNFIMLIIANPVANMFLISFILSYALPDSFDREEAKVVEEKADISEETEQKQD